VSIKDRSPDFATLPSQVAAIVPEGSREDGKWNAKEYGMTPGVSEAQWKQGIQLKVHQDERLKKHLLMQDGRRRRQKILRLL
jgi:hypothetical protein